MNGNGSIEHRRLAEMFPALPNDPVMPNWRRLMLELDLRLGTLQGINKDWEAAVHQLQQLALTRLNEVLGPAYERLLAFATLGPGWTLARSSTEASLQLGQNYNFIIDAGPYQETTQRDLFVASQFAIIQHEETRANFAVVRVLNYLSASGALAVTVLVQRGTPGPFDKWLIFSAPGAGATDGGTF